MVSLSLNSGYVYCHQGLNSAHCKLSFGVFGETVHSEIEPTFGVDSMVSFDTIVDAAEPVLGDQVGTLNSDICLTSWMLPASKLEER